MNIEIINDQIDETIVLNADEELVLTKKINTLFERFEQERSTQLSDIKLVRDEIYRLQGGAKGNWSADVVLPDIYEAAQTLKAHLVENLYSTPEAMFDVAGLNPEAQATAASQKAMLINAFEKMRIDSELESVVDSVIEAGEATLFVGWSTRHKQVRRALTLEERLSASYIDDISPDAYKSSNPLIAPRFKGFQPYSHCGLLPDGEPEGIFDPKTVALQGSGGSRGENPAENKTQTLAPQAFTTKSGYIIENKVVYDGAVVKHIPPEDFVFDTSRKSNWDACAKLYRNWQTLDELKKNPNNNLLTPEKIEDLAGTTGKSGLNKGSKPYSASGKAKPETRSAGGFTDSKSPTKSGQLEIIEFWGDIELEDGTMLKNWLIVVANGKHIVRFEPNPFIINPFIHGAIITDPQTARGVSPLRVALILSTLSSTILNKQLDALSLIINPPYLAPKGCFKGEQMVKPGKIIEYDAALMPNQPIPLHFESALHGWDFIKYFKSTIEGTTGIYKNMAGDINASARTATELNYSAGGQTARLNMIIDAINRKIIIPMVEKTADIIANFKYGKEKILVREGAQVVFMDICDQIRSGDYMYHYGDRKASLERKFRFKELFSLIDTFAKVPAVAGQIDWPECFKFALEQYGIENANNFLLDTLPQ